MILGITLSVIIIALCVLLTLNICKREFRKWHSYKRKHRTKNDGYSESPRIVGTHEPDYYGHADYEDE